MGSQAEPAEQRERTWHGGHPVDAGLPRGGRGSSRKGQWGGAVVARISGAQAGLGEDSQSARWSRTCRSASAEISLAQGCWAPRDTAGCVGCPLRGGGGAGHPRTGRNACRGVPGRGAGGTRVPAWWEATVSLGVRNTCAASQVCLSGGGCRGGQALTSCTSPAPACGTRRTGLGFRAGLFSRNLIPLLARV